MCPDVVNCAWGAHLCADLLLEELDKTCGWWQARAIKHAITYR